MGLRALRLGFRAGLPAARAAGFPAPRRASVTFTLLFRATPKPGNASVAILAQVDFSTSMGPRIADRSRSRSCRRSSRDRNAKVVTKIFTMDNRRSILSINADLVDPMILKSAKNVANTMLNVDGSVDEFIEDFPHGIGGGWHGVDPMDDFITYSHVKQGEFQGIVAMSTGSNQKIRSQAVALGLVLSAAVNIGESVIPKGYEELAGLSDLIEQGQLAWKEEGMVDRHPSNRDPAARERAASSRDARPRAARTDRSVDHDLRQFRHDLTLVRNTLHDMETRLRELESL